MTKQQAIDAMKARHKVVAGTREDYDAGYINNVDDRFAYVAWDSGVITPCPLDMLELALR